MNTTASARKILGLLVALLPACSADVFAVGDGAPGDGSPEDALVVGPDGGDPDAGDAAEPGADASSDVVITPEAEAGPSFKRVFISSTKTQSNFGSLAAADAICQSDAASASLGGTWKAWLSTGTTSAASRLSHASVPYQLVDGTEVAANWTALVSGASLKNAIDLDEHGTYVTFNDSSQLGYTWTGTSADGSSSGETCSDWTVTETCTSTNYFGTTGTDGNVDSRWTARGTPACCTTQVFALFCFEQ